MINNLPANAGDIRDKGSIPGSGRPLWRRKWHPTAVFLLGESHGQRHLVGYSSQGCKESDMTERLSAHTHTLNDIRVTQYVQGENAPKRACICVFMYTIHILLPSPIHSSAPSFLKLKEVGKN